MILHKSEANVEDFASIAN